VDPAPPKQPLPDEQPTGPEPTAPGGDPETPDAGDDLSPITVDDVNTVGPPPYDGPTIGPAEPSAGEPESDFEPDDEQHEPEYEATETEKTIERLQWMKELQLIQEANEEEIRRGEF
jgi:hypothetical protein